MRVEQLDDIYLEFTIAVFTLCLLFALIPYLSHLGHGRSGHLALLSEIHVKEIQIIFEEIALEIGFLKDWFYLQCVKRRRPQWHSEPGRVMLAILSCFGPAIMLPSFLILIQAWHFTIGRFHIWRFLWPACNYSSPIPRLRAVTSPRIQASEQRLPPRGLHGGLRCGHLLWL